MGWRTPEFCDLLGAGELQVIRYDHRDTGPSSTSPPGQSDHTGDAPAMHTGDDVAEDPLRILDHISPQRGGLPGCCPQIFGWSWCVSIAASRVVGMFDDGLGVAELDSLLSALPGLDTEVDDAGRIDQLAALERLKSACAAAQARVTGALHDSCRQAEAAAGIPAKKRDAGLADEIALARGEATSRGNQHLGLGLALTREMPHTLTALSAGAISEWKATILVRETALLTVEQRAEVDARLRDRCTRLGTRALANAARAIAHELDPTTATRRARAAAADRRVTIRPAPDAMAWVSAFVPVAQGVASYAALTRAADTTRNTGENEQRSRSQVVADVFVERLTGQATAPAVPLGIGLIMTDHTLLTGGDTPAEVTGAGPIPAGIARDLIANTLTDDDDPQREKAEAARVWLHRLYTHPTTGSLMAMDSRAREFTGSLRHYLITRDQYCRTPWCDAPIRHLDHIQPVREGGETSAQNGQGLCERCNYTKQLPGWRTTRTGADPPDNDNDDGHRVEIITPTGHTYTTTTPEPLSGLGLSTTRSRDGPHAADLG